MKDGPAIEGYTIPIITKMVQVGMIPASPECDDPLDKLHNPPGNPVHKHSNGEWWFYDESWAFEYGPYPTEEDANRNLRQYCEQDLESTC